jgi:uncharacterized protein
MMRRLLIGIPSLALALGCAGCGRSPRVNFYTLEAAARAESGGGIQPAPSVSVGPVSIPEVVNRPQLVVRVGANRVAVLEAERWAEPLKSEIPRLIAQNLGLLLASSRVASYQELTAASADFRVLVDLVRFEATSGDAVTIEADWSVRRSALSTGAPLRGRSSIREKVVGSGYDALVAAYNRGLLRLSEDLAGAVRAEAAKPLDAERSRKSGRSDLPGRK